MIFINVNVVCGELTLNIRTHTQTHTLVDALMDVAYCTVYE